MRKLNDAINASKFLVVDDSSFQRGLTCEVLRSTGGTDIEVAGGVADALSVLRVYHPTILIVDWVMPDTDGIEFTKMIRRGETPMKRDIAVIMVTGRKTMDDVETARMAGVDEFLIKPFNTHGLLSRLSEVLFNRRAFVDSAIYVGPCRRRRFLEDYEGPKRRLFDDDVDADSPEIILAKTLARAKISNAAMAARTLVPGDRSALRDFYKLGREIREKVADTGDRLLISAAQSMVAYIEGVGASPRMDAKVIDAHIEAMTQLVNLPHVHEDMRERVAGALHAMVKKKLGAA